MISDLPAQETGSKHEPLVAGQLSKNGIWVSELVLTAEIQISNHSSTVLDTLPWEEQGSLRACQYNELFGRVSKTTRVPYDSSWCRLDEQVKLSWCEQPKPSQRGARASLYVC